MFKIKIPLLLSLFITLLTTAAAVFATKYFVENSVAATDITDVELQKCEYYKLRLSGYKFIKPLLLAGSSCPSQRMNSISMKIQEVINKYKQSGILESASVYLSEKGEWTTAGDNLKYLPGSLMKVPELITILKMNETNPGLLDKEILYVKTNSSPKTVTYTSQSIVDGKTYTIRELLKYMIVYSDNEATILLNSLVDLNAFKKLFTDYGIPEPDFSKNDIPLTADEFSIFMRAIYNATYLSNNDSEFCAELLSKSEFSLGMVNGLPKGTQVVHKFGEAGDRTSSYFCESGYVYTPSNTYLLTVMTKGKKLSDLPAVVSEISRTTYNLVKN